MKEVIVKANEKCSSADYQDMSLQISIKQNKFGTMWYCRPKIRICFETCVTDYFIFTNDKGTQVFAVNDFDPLQNELNKIAKAMSQKIDTKNVETKKYENIIFLKISKNLQRFDGFTSVKTFEIPIDQKLKIVVDVYGVFVKQNVIHVQMELSQFYVTESSCLSQVIS